MRVITSAAARPMDPCALTAAGQGALLVTHESLSFEFELSGPGPARHGWSHLCFSFSLVWPPCTRARCRGADDCERPGRSVRPARGVNMVPGPSAAPAPPPAIDLAACLDDHCVVLNVEKLVEMRPSLARDFPAVAGVDLISGGLPFGTAALLRLQWMQGYGYKIDLCSLYIHWDVVTNAEYLIGWSIPSTWRQISADYFWSLCRSTTRLSSGRTDVRPPEKMIMVVYTWYLQAHLIRNVRRASDASAALPACEAADDFFASMRAPTRLLNAISYAMWHSKGPMHAAQRDCSDSCLECFYDCSYGCYSCYTCCRKSGARMSEADEYGVSERSTEVTPRHEGEARAPERIDRV